MKKGVILAGFGIGLALILAGCVAVPITIQDNSAPVRVELLNRNDVLSGTAP